MERVTCFKCSDDTIHRTESEAEAHERRLKIETKVQDFCAKHFGHYDFDTAETIIENWDELVSLGD